jgi:hypothetical protein
MTTMGEKLSEKEFDEMLTILKVKDDKIRIEGELYFEQF